jgi:hypothetical protein
MAEKMKALFRGPINPDGTPAAWLAAEPGTVAGVDPEGTPIPAVPETPAVPARHLTQEEYDALTPRNKERVREAKHDGKPLYDVRSEKEMAAAGDEAQMPPPRAVTKGSDA